MSKLDKRTFFRAWRRAPLRIASVMPSSKSLVTLMTKEVAIETGPVLELGPGTGVFTDALRIRGVREKDITLVEFEREFITLLRHRFPKARLCPMDVREIGRRDIFEDTIFGAVISGLPLPTMKQEDLFNLIKSCFQRLNPEGAFYQFTYGFVCPVPVEILRSLGLRAEKVGWTVLNFPPAAVYRIRRNDALPG